MSYKEALMRFSFDNSSQTLIVSLAGSASGLLIYGVDVKPVESGVLKYDMRQPLVETLKAMQDDISRLLQVTYPSGEKETFDTTVVSMINGMDTSTSTISKDFLEKMKVRKAYARYYYDMFRKRTVEYDENKNKDAVILTSLVSYYFMKRLVHVFVMCTIFETISSVSMTSNSSQPIIINQTNTSSTSNSTSSNSFAKERIKFEAEIANLEASIKNVTDLTESEKEKRKEIDNKHNELLAIAEKKIEGLEAQVNNYRELLLKSTTMIFKLDEIPNVLKL